MVQHLQYLLSRHCSFPSSMFCCISIISISLPACSSCATCCPHTSRYHHPFLNSPNPSSFHKGPLTAFSLSSTCLPSSLFSSHSPSVHFIILLLEDKDERTQWKCVHAENMDMHFYGCFFEGHNFFSFTYIEKTYDTIVKFSWYAYLPEDNRGAIPYGSFPSRFLMKVCLKDATHVA